MKCCRCPLYHYWSNESDRGEACAIFGDGWDSPFQYEDKEGTIIGCYLDRHFIEKADAERDEYYESMAESIARDLGFTADTPQTEYSCETCANKGNHDDKCRNCVVDSEAIRWKTPSNYEPQTDCLEQFRVGLEYHKDTTHFGKAKGESVTTNRVEGEPQTEMPEYEAWKEPFETMAERG